MGVMKKVSYFVRDLSFLYSCSTVFPTKSFCITHMQQHNAHEGLARIMFRQWRSRHWEGLAIQYSRLPHLIHRDEFKTGHFQIGQNGISKRCDCWPCLAFMQYHD